MSYLLDSVILIDHLNGVPAAENYLLAVRDASISVITRTEVLTGCDVSEIAGAEELLNRYPTLSIDREVADLAALLRRQHRWRLPDAFQAALAKIHGLRLVTRNTKDFPPAKHKFVVLPYEI
ncbi:MAG: PIN domain-containing protein [Acidobacteriota bacterium]